MYPLIQVGPFRLSSGGLCLLLAIVVFSVLIERIAAQRTGRMLAEQAGRVFLPALVGAAIGGRLWYGAFNWDLYGRMPSLFIALRVADFAWPGALFGGMFAGWLWGRWQGFDSVALADTAALSLPLAQAIASIGALLSGEAFGQPTDLPWGIPLFGTLRHPTQLYLFGASLFCAGALALLAHRTLPAGGLSASYLGFHGLTLLLVEVFRADSLLLPYGIRAAQVVGLALMLWALFWWRRSITHDPPTVPRTSVG
jgi:phosphatidylglycerol---prolipoprotein diacylglyceryl transferase